MFLVGIFALIAGGLLAAGIISTADAGDEVVALGSAASIVLIIIGIIYLIIAGGFWNGWKIMWYLGLIFTLISLIMEIVSLVNSGFAGIGVSVIIPIVIDLVILYYLFRPGVKQFFGI